MITKTDSDLLFKEKDDRETERDLARQLVEDNGPALVNGTVRACLFFLPTYMIPECSEVLYELMVVNRPVSYFTSSTVITHHQRYLVVSLRTTPTRLSSSFSNLLSHFVFILL